MYPLVPNIDSQSTYQPSRDRKRNIIQIPNLSCEVFGFYTVRRNSIETGHSVGLPIKKKLNRT